jgi:signal transduction histidine kinase
MTAIIIILSIALAVMLTLCVLQKKEINSITKQLRELKNKDTNAIISSQNGTADKLIMEINALLKEMREIKISYHQKNHALEQMMTNISHDLRTPLTSAMGYIDLIQYSELSEEEKLIIVLHYYEDMSLKDIERKTGLSYGQVKIRHNNALKVLRKLL